MPRIVEDMVVLTRDELVLLNIIARNHSERRLNGDHFDTFSGGSIAYINDDGEKKLDPSGFNVVNHFVPLGKKGDHYRVVVSAKVVGSTTPSIVMVDIDREMREVIQESFKNSQSLLEHPEIDSYMPKD